jgi:hypothetical protein
MSEQGWQEFLAAEDVADWVVLHGDGSKAPEAWTLADRAGNRVCICAWPDGSSRPAPTGPESCGPGEDGQA